MQEKPFSRTPSRVEIKKTRSEMLDWFKKMTQKAEEEFEKEVKKLESRTQRIRNALSKTGH